MWEGRVHWGSAYPSVIKANHPLELRTPLPLKPLAGRVKERFEFPAPAAGVSLWELLSPAPASRGAVLPKADSTAFSLPFTEAQPFLPREPNAQWAGR